jgi:adenine-specific DNA-methyltransferase
MSNYENLQKVLKEIFEMDKADLDFGIYRIMNQKRDQVMEFVDRRLPRDIKDVLGAIQSKDSISLRQELDKMGKALDDAGVVREESPKYMILQQQIINAIDTNALEQEVFSHLASFFKRYYKDGDFISLRRYKKDVYAIPYEGEEVKLHWANADQYYIKTSEYLKNYAFKLSDGKKVNFQLKEASTEQSNNKTQGDVERRFAIYEELPLEVMEDELYINFSYETHRKTVNQDELTKQAFEVIQANIPSAFTLAFDKVPTEKNKNRTLLEKHLNNFISRNSFDYFIHKDLGGFLCRELDFYIKNEVLFIDDINTESPIYFTAQLSKIKALKIVATKIITFLAQIEDFQKKLWLKKKFVISTNYCITIDRIPEKYHNEIFANSAQLAEWKTLFDVTPSVVEALSLDTFLVLDTKFFSEDFKDRLLAEFDNLDEETDGLLINADNFQALNILETKYYEKINAIHIDPPYNTSTSGFLYKNTFQSSSWMSFMFDRAQISYSLLNDNGSFICHIDENEYERLFLLMEAFPFYNSGTIIWDKRNPMTGGSGIATQHEYILWKNKNVTTINLNSGNVEAMLNKVKLLKEKHNNSVTDLAKKELSEWININQELSGGEKAYRYIDDKWNLYQSVSLRAPEKRENQKFHQPLIHPLTKKPCATPPNGFSRTPETLQQMIDNDLILFGQDESTQPRQKMILKPTKKNQLTSVIQDATRGKGDLDKLGLAFPYNHSAAHYKYLIDATVDEDKKIILDYFAGSGTTGHATIKLNREDGGKRKFILVEMGSYFNTVTKPRIQKVIYSDNWKNGKPQDGKGISQMFKYQVLESYEDALNNLQLAKSASKGLLPFSEAAQEEYLLKYMLDVETQDHLFNIEMFRNPFNYQLNVTENNELVSTKIDLVETFNYLIGMYVSRVQRIKEIKLIEGKTREGIKTLIIWRNLETIKHDDVAKVFRKLYDGVRSSEFDQIYINGDHHFDNIRTSGDTFKVKMIEETFFKKMFHISEM